MLKENARFKELVVSLQDQNKKKRLKIKLGIMSHTIMRIMSYNKLEYLGHELQSTVVLHSCFL